MSRPSLPRALLRELRRRWRAFIYRGTKRECIVCGGRFRKFLTTGVDRRPDARCPRCGSLERHRLLCHFLERNREELLPGLDRDGERARAFKLLHIAPEDCLASWLDRLPEVDRITLDLEASDVDLRADLTRLPLADAHFDAVLCNHVLEHIPDDHKALEELHRVLKPRAWAIIQVPLDKARATTDEDPTITDPREREDRFGQEDHVRLYGRDYGNKIQKAGFDLRVETPAQDLPKPRQKRWSLDPNEEVYLARATTTQVPKFPNLGQNPEPGSGKGNPSRMVQNKHKQLK